MKRGDLKAVTLVSFFFLLMGFSVNDSAFGQEATYPNRSIDFLIGFGPGGTTDLTYRAFCTAASKHLGQTIVPINAPGAGSALAAAKIAAAKPDGYTLGGGTTSNALIAPFAPNNPYKSLDSFTFIANIGQYKYAMIVSNDAPWKDWKEFMTYAKKNPGAVKVGLPGAKTNMTQGLVLSIAEKKEKAKFVYVPFKSGPEVLAAVLGKHVTLFPCTLDANVMSFVKSGKARLLAFLDLKLKGYENIPSLKEIYGLKVIPNIKTIWGPKGLPISVVKKLEAASEKATKDRDFINVMERFYISVVYMNSQEITKDAKRAFAEVGEIIKTLRAEEKK
jgi:tripartite-type tricarboxylate transporter receptor subunit TctC